jgi:hypothetical protein
MHKLTDGNMKISVAALAIGLITGPVLIQPAFAEAPDSVNVGARVSARTRTQSSGSKCVAISTNVTFCRGAGDLFLFGHVDAYPPGSFRLHRAVPGR